MFFFPSSIRFSHMFIRHFFLSTNNFAHMQTLFRISSQSNHVNIRRINNELFTGCKKIKQGRIFFVLGYLRMILWKISTAISIKHRILATFSINKKFNSDSLYAFNLFSLRYSWKIAHLELNNYSLTTSLCGAVVVVW